LQWLLPAGSSCRTTVDGQPAANPGYTHLAIIFKNIDKLAVFTYLLDTHPLFYIPHLIISDFEIRASDFRFIRFGGETASTGIKKLELHTEHPVSS
jgi:hypothetical protein